MPDAGTFAVASYPAGAIGVSGGIDFTAGLFCRGSREHSECVK
jgi:hypothetical protein